MRPEVLFTFKHNDVSISRQFGCGGCSRDTSANDDNVGRRDRHYRSRPDITLRHV
jgi:hypothetical protein